MLEPAAASRSPRRSRRPNLAHDEIMARLDQLSAQMAALTGMCRPRWPPSVAILTALVAVRPDAAARARPRARDRASSRPARSTPSPTSTACGSATRRIVEGDARPDRRDRDRAARRERLPGQGGRRRLRRQRVRQAGRVDAGRRARHDRDADRAHQHAERRRRRWTPSCATRWRSRATSRCGRSTRWSARPTTAG